jgi:hypothetical protein
MAVIIRDVFQCKYGESEKLEDLFRQAAPWFKEHGMSSFTLMEDLSGEFFTLVTEYRAESMGAWERDRDKVFSDQRFGPWFEEMKKVVESGRREFWNIVIEA